MDKRNKYIVVILFCFALSLVTIVPTLTPISYPGGWEVDVGMNSIAVNQHSYTIDNKPENTYSFGDAYAKFDVDGNKTGVPTLSIQVYAPIEYISVDGEWVKARPGEYYKDIQKPVGNDIYFFYQHVFFFDVDIIAEADYLDANAVSGTTGEANGMIGAISAQISTTLLFDANIWSVLSQIQSDNGTAVYVNSGVWTGVMSASVFGSYGGYVDPLPSGFAGINGEWSVTNVGRLNMFEVDGSNIPDTSFDTFDTQPAAIEYVPSKFLIEIGGTDLIPGWWWPPLGAVNRYAVEATYRVRADIVTSAKYTFEQGDQDDTVNPKSISHEPGYGILYDFAAWFSGVLASLAFPLTTICIIVGGVIIIYVVLRRRK